MKPRLCLQQSDCGWKAADGLFSFWKFPRFLHIDADLNAPRLYVDKEHFSAWIGGRGGSLAHAGKRAVLVLTCRQQCANKAGVIAPAQVSSYC